MEKANQKSPLRYSPINDAPRGDVFRPRESDPVPRNQDKSLYVYEYDNADPKLGYSSLLNLSNISHLSNSKAIVKALQSLQDKIQKLEYERDFYRTKHQRYVRETQEEMNDIKIEKINLLKDKEYLLRERERLAEENQILKEQIQLVRTNSIVVPRNGNPSILEQSKINNVPVVVDVRDSQALQIRDENTKERADNAKLIESLENVKFDLTKRVLKLTNKVENLQQKNENRKGKIQNLSNMLVEEKRRNEVLDERSRKLNTTVETLLDVNNSRSFNKSGVGDIGDNEVHASVHSQQRKRKNKSRKKHNTSYFRFLAKNNMQKRLMRANMDKMVPFIREGSDVKKSYNVNSLVQRGIKVGSRRNSPKTRKKSKTMYVKTNAKSESADMTRQLQMEHDNLLAEYNNILQRNARKLDAGEEEDGRKIRTQLQVIAQLLERKQNQMRYLREYEFGLGKTWNVPYVRGAQKRNKTLKLFRKLRKNVLKKK